ncbi:MAG: winged helix-turn-helix domain-containing protein [Thermoplasmata archaeon]
MRRDIMVVSDKDMIKMCIEDTRMKIISLLRVRNMSISQLSRTLEKEPSTIYRHLKKLERSGFVMVCGERKVHHIPEKLYGRTADSFVFTPIHGKAGDDGSETDWNAQYNHTVHRIIEAMDVLGYEIEASEEHIENLSMFLFNLDEMIGELVERSQDKLPNINPVGVIRLKLLFFILEFMENEDCREDIKKIVDMFQESPTYV